MGFAVRVYVHVQSHRVATDWAVLDIVMVRAGRDIHRHDDFFTARVASIDGFLMSLRECSAVFLLGILHEWQRDE